MKQTKHTAAVLIPVLMLLVWACGGGEPQTRAVQGAGALSAQPVASASISTTVAEPEPDNTRRNGAASGDLPGGNYPSLHADRP